MKKILAITGIMAVSIGAQAAELNLDEKYVIGTFASTTYDDFDSTTGFGIGIGAPLEGIELVDDSELFVEAGYNMLGESSEDLVGGEATLSASTIYALGKMRFEVKDQIFAYAKLGLNMITAEAEVKVTGFGSGSASDTETKLLYGAGIEYQVNDEVSVTGEYVAFSSDITALTANVLYKF